MDYPTPEPFAGTTSHGYTPDEIKQLKKDRAEADALFQKQASQRLGAIQRIVPNKLSRETMAEAHEDAIKEDIQRSIEQRELREGIKSRDRLEAFCKDPKAARKFFDLFKHPGYPLREGFGDLYDQLYFSTGKKITEPNPGIEILEPDLFASLSSGEKNPLLRDEYHQRGPITFWGREDYSMRRRCVTQDHGILTTSEVARLREGGEVVHVHVVVDVESADYYDSSSFTKYYEQTRVLFQFPNDTIALRNEPQQ